MQFAHSRTVIIALCLLPLSSALFAEPFGAGEAAESPPPVDVRVNRPQGVFRAGDRLRVAVQSKIDSFVYVLYHQANGEAVLIYPTFASGTAAVSAGSRIEVSGDEEGTEIRVSEPFGREVVQVLVARRPLSELENRIDYRAKGYPVLRSTDIDRLCEQLYAGGLLHGDPRLIIQTKPRRSGVIEDKQAPTR